MNKYDVVIIGGGTAGCSCAWNCGRLGLKTLIIEKSEVLGGSMTAGLVVPAMSTGKNLINTDFYNHLINELKNFGGQITYQENPGWFNPELLKILLDKILIDKNVEIRFDTEVKNVKISNKHISCIEINNSTLSSHINSIYTNNNTTICDDILSEYIETSYVVDTSGDGNFSKKINCEILENPKEFQPMSLRFIMSGIDIDKFADYILKTDNNRDVTTVEYIDGQTHLSTAYTWDAANKWALAPIFDDAVSNNILKDTDRNYFQVFTIAGMSGSIAFNCPRIVKKLNPNSCKDRSVALIEARQAIYRISEFCKKYFPGFENAYISNISDFLGVRASNRVKGKYIYSIDDIRKGKTFDNPALISNYPVDVHNSNKNSSILENTGEYQLPIESLMSDDFDNLYIAGRNLSADYLAQGALRVQANCFSMGEAVAKHIKTRIG